jgi:hypothetical protein
VKEEKSLKIVPVDPEEKSMSLDPSDARVLECLHFLESLIGRLIELSAIIEESPDERIAGLRNDIVDINADIIRFGIKMRANIGICCCGREND